MATVRLRGHVSEEGDLPDVCMRCGAPAAVYKDKSFSWFPGWIYILILAGLLVFLILAVVLTKYRRVCVPLCERHKNHWLNRQLGLLLSFLGLLALGGLTVFFIADSRPGSDGETIGQVLCVGSLVSLLGWLVLAAVLQTTAIRPVEITERRITLTGVSREFVDAYEDLLESEEEWLDRAACERWERRRRYREDDPPERRRYRRGEDEEDDDEPPRRRSDCYRPRE